MEKMIVVDGKFVVAGMGKEEELIYNDDFAVKIDDDIVEISARGRLFSHLIGN